MNKYDRYRNELMRINNNIQFYKHKIALCQASNARMFYEKLLSKEAKRFHDLQVQYEQFDLKYKQLSSLPEDDGTALDEMGEELVPENTMNEMGEPEDPESTVDELINPEQPLNGTLNSEEDVPLEGQRVFTLEELSKFNGTNGQPAYVAVNGIVYDVSSIQRWAGGTHFSLFAGRDLSNNFNVCHGGNTEKLLNLPVVGTLKVD